MNSSYRLGIKIVLSVVLISAGACLALVYRRGPAAARAAEELRADAFDLGAFRLMERSGRTVTDADLAGRVCIASFIFTRCPLSCPRITNLMKRLEGRLAGTSVLLLSFSVDPEHDTPAVLSDFARRYGASSDRWWFLTGPKSTIYELVRDRFKLTLAETPSALRDGGTEAISHSDRLALVDRGKVIGFFASDDVESVEALVASVRRLAQPYWVQLLPAVNASLNALCAALLLAGWTMIRRRDPVHSELPGFAPQRNHGTNLLNQPSVRAHVRLMLLAVTTSALFLALYLVYHYRVGSVPFRRSGPVRLTYFTILASHSILAAFGVVPLVILTLVPALRHRFERHLLVARITFPIWIYVSVTGVVIYMMLYRLPYPQAQFSPPTP